MQIDVDDLARVKLGADELFVVRLPARTDLETAAATAAALHDQLGRDRAVVLVGVAGHDTIGIAQLRALIVTELNRIRRVPYSDTLEGPDPDTIPDTLATAIYNRLSGRTTTHGTPPDLHEPPWRPPEYLDTERTEDASDER